MHFDEIHTSHDITTITTTTTTVHFRGYHLSRKRHWCSLRGPLSSGRN